MQLDDDPPSLGQFASLGHSASLDHYGRSASLGRDIAQNMSVDTSTESYASLDLTNSMSKLSVGSLCQNTNIMSATSLFLQSTASQKIAFLRELVKRGGLDDEDIYDETLGKEIARKLSPPKNVKTATKSTLVGKSTSVGTPCCPECSKPFTDFAYFGHHCNGPHKKAYKIYQCYCTGKTLQYSDLRSLHHFVPSTIASQLKEPAICQWQCKKKIYQKAHKNGVPGGKEDWFWHLRCRGVQWTRCNHCKNLYKHHSGASGYRRKTECQQLRDATV